MSSKEKIGIYLGTLPESGGQFQWDLSVLKGLLSIMEKKYDLYIFYKNKIWEQYFDHREGIEAIFLLQTLSYRVINRIFKILKASLAKRLFPYLHPLGKIVKKKYIEIFILPSEANLGYLMPSKNITVVHDLMYLYEPNFPEVSNKKEKRRRSKIYKNVVTYSDIIIVDSQIGKEQVCESFNVKNHNQIRILRHVPPNHLTEENATFPKGAGKLPKSFFYYPAQFWFHKNHMNLIHAVNLLKRMKLNISIILTGTPKNSFKFTMGLIKKLKLEKNFYYLGYVSENEKIWLYKNAFALVMPSFFGPTNIPPLEALVLGCPVLCSDIYGVKEELGNSAIYFDPKSPKSIAKAIRTVWYDESLRNKLISVGKEHSKLWNQEKFNQKLNEIVGSI